MATANWSLLQNGQSGFQNALALGVEAGIQIRQAQDRKEYRSALGMLATEPENKSALAMAFQHDPRAGIALADRADDMAFRRDAAALYGGAQPNAPIQPNALSEFASRAQPAPIEHSHTAPMASANEVGQAEADPLAFLGQPRNQEDQVFLRMLRTDPERAIKLQGEMRDRLVSQMEAESDFYGFAMGELSRATDPQSWGTALRTIVPRAQQLGFDIMKHVPNQYPGPDGVKALMERAQPIKDQLDRMVREANIEADNIRADRNTDSLIETREGRLDEYERHNRANEGLRRRGQDLTDARGRRGQNLTHSRARSRGSSSRGSRPRDGIKTVKSVSEAQRLPKGTRFRTPDGRIKVAQ